MTMGDADRPGRRQDPGEQERLRRYRDVADHYAPAGWRTRVLIGLAGALLGCGVTFHALGWSALLIESHGGCGARHPTPCPSGLSPVLILGFPIITAGLGAVVRLWERPKVTSGMRNVALVVGFVAGMAAGWLAYHAVRAAA